MKKNWWKEAVGYQIYPKSFKDSNGDGIGDIQGIISKLDYLKDLGIDVIWICPMYDSPNKDNGYDIRDYRKILAEFGTMEDFDELLKEIHIRGMKLIMDLVANHTSNEHEWFIESKSSKDNPKRDWYIWRDGKDGKEPNNWESIFKGSAWKYDETTNQYYLHLFTEEQPDLNWENPEVRQEIYKMINWWLDKGIDGFRVDAISHIKKDQTFENMPDPEKKGYVAAFDKMMNYEGIHEFLHELKNETFAKYDIMTVAEGNGVKAETDAEAWVGEENGSFNMVFQFEHLDLWEAENLDDKEMILKLKRALSKWQDALEGKGWNALFIENHDISRAVSTLGNDEKYRKESAKALAMMYFMQKGTPFIYQGQEIGMKNAAFESTEDYDDVKSVNIYKENIRNGMPPEEALKIVWRTSRDNSRTPMQWDNSKNAGFTTGTPWLKLNSDYTITNVANDLDDENSILNFYKKLIKIKKGSETLIYGKYTLIDKDNPYIYSYIRELKGKKYIIICNLSDNEKLFKQNEILKYKNILLSNYTIGCHEDTSQVNLKPWECRMYKID